MPDRPSLAGRSVMVLGGAGFIGSHVVDRLADESPRRLSVVDNLFLAQARERLGDVLRFRNLDATDADALGAAMREDGTEVVFNLAVVPLPASLDRPRWSVEHNVELALVPCELGRLGLFQTLVHVSSSEAYGSAAYVPMDENHPPVR